MPCGGCIGDGLDTLGTVTHGCGVLWARPLNWRLWAALMPSAVVSEPLRLCQQSDSGPRAL